MGLDYPDQGLPWKAGRGVLNFVQVLSQDHTNLWEVKTFRYAGNAQRYIETLRILDYKKITIDVMYISKHSPLVRMQCHDSEYAPKPRKKVSTNE